MLELLFRIVVLLLCLIVLNLLLLCYFSDVSC